MESRKMVVMNLFGDADRESRLVDAVGGGGAGMVAW